jgi:hypothetical protein
MKGDEPDTAYQSPSNVSSGDLTKVEPNGSEDANEPTGRQTERLRYIRDPEQKRSAQQPSYKPSGYDEDSMGSAGQKTTSETESSIHSEALEDSAESSEGQYSSHEAKVTR